MSCCNDVFNKIDSSWTFSLICIQLIALYAPFRICSPKRRLCSLARCLKVGTCSRKVTNKVICFLFYYVVFIGFRERLSAATQRFAKVEIFKLSGSAAIGAALLAAKHARKEDVGSVDVLKLYETLQCRVLFDELNFD